MFETVFCLSNSKISHYPQNSDSLYGCHSIIPQFLRVYLNLARYSLSFHAVESGIDDTDILKSRIIREKDSLDNFMSKTRSRFLSYQELHHFMFTKHSAYAANRLLKSPTDQLDLNVLKTY